MRSDRSLILSDVLLRSQGPCIPLIYGKLCCNLAAQQRSVAPPSFIPVIQRLQGHLPGDTVCRGRPMSKSLVHGRNCTSCCREGSNMMRATMCVPLGWVGKKLQRTAAETTPGETCLLGRKDESTLVRGGDLTAWRKSDSRRAN